ncbi:MAG: iron ABC transporter permease [Planctomycetota bacterium]|nr:iron ABC transporter permease [Planctomycetota bacterium]
MESSQGLSKYKAYGLSLLIFLVVIGASPFITRGSGSEYAFWALLLPRALTAGLAGAVLASCGVTLQNVLKNDLASPFTLGVASGASLGAAITIKFEWTEPFLGIPFLQPIVVFALIGALCSTFAIYAVARREGGLSETLLLAGVGLSLLVNSLVTAMFLIDDAPRYTNLLIWTMGDLQQVRFTGLKLMSIPVIIGALALCTIIRDLNIIALDEESALGLGVHAQRARKVALIATGLMTAGLVAAVGPIGFVGLIVPHAVRRVTGPNALVVLPCAALLGGAFLCLCDLVSRLALYPIELPIGVVTSMIGSPIFIAMLLRRRR